VSENTQQDEEKHPTLSAGRWKCPLRQRGTGWKSVILLPAVGVLATGMMIAIEVTTHAITINCSVEKCGCSSAIEF
jgi:hypothetical protein